jgi:DNA-binding transcriptional MocR family regulator
MTSSVWKRNAQGHTVRRKRNKHGPKFVQLFDWMLKTPAWRSLSFAAIAAYIELARHYNGINNGELHLSARELAKGRYCSRQTAARAIAELVDKGFIEITRDSGFNVKSHARQARQYRLTVFFCNLTRQPASRAFAKWKPYAPPKKHSSASPESHIGLTGEAEGKKLQ